MTDPHALDPAVLLAQQGWVERLARGLVRDSSLAQDLAQEAWLEAARKGPEDIGERRGFLAGVVRNLKRSHARAERRRERREEIAARPEALPSPAELVERAELQRLLVENVLALDKGYGEAERTAVLLRYFEGLTAEEIAHRSHVPAGTVRSRLSRGLERLRERLEQRFDRHELFAGLCVLAREPGLPAPAAPDSGSASPWSALPLTGGLLAMKTLTTIAAGCAVLLTVAAGLWFLGRDSLPHSGQRAEDAHELAVALEPAGTSAPVLAPEEARAQRTSLESPRAPEPDGAPVAGAQIHTWFMAASFGTGTTLEAYADGRFEILLQQRVAHDLTISDAKNRWSEIYLFGVEPGTRELEIRFEPERWIDVQVSAPDGAPLEGFVLGLESAAEGNWLRMTPRTGEAAAADAAGHARLRVPNAAFRVTADAPGREHVVRGPFDPRTPPETLAFELAALAGVRGVVLTSAGLPAAGAKVGLYRAVGEKLVVQRNGFRLRTEDWSELTTTTDGDGRFVLYPQAPREGKYASDLFVLRAEAAGHARSELPPQHFDPREGAELELRLVQGGAIEGRAETAPGIDPTGFLIAFHRGDGDVRTQRLGPDGRYRIAGLTPGGWHVFPLDEELHGNRSSSSSSYHEEGAPPFEEWSCVVIDGETTRYDLDFTNRAPCTLRGELALEGRSCERWSASLERELGTGDEVLGSVLLDAQGRFELVAPRGGSYRLVLRSPEEPSGRLVLREDLELAPGTSSWNLALRPGRLEGSGALGRGTRERFYSYDWDGSVADHALVANVRIVPDSDGRFVLPTVPEGPGKISRNDPLAEGQEFAPWEVVSEFELAPGGVEHVRLP
jgi:RNA polymerase sigma-70 factor (ECF subfamily)